MESLPKDPHILLLFTNYMLKNQYDSLDAFCQEYNVKSDELVLKCMSIDYRYDPSMNQFK